MPFTHIDRLPAAVTEGLVAGSLVPYLGAGMLARGSQRACRLDCRQNLGE